MRIRWLLKDVNFLLTSYLKVIKYSHIFIAIFLPYEYNNTKSMKEVSIWQQKVFFTKKAEAFITALERAAETAGNYPLRHVESEDIKGEDIKKLLGALAK